jgi:hypothetical protein
MNSESDKLFNDLIKIMERVRNCNNMYNKLKLIQRNSYWTKEGREKYGPVKDMWYEHVKNEIDVCIRLIEEVKGE